MADEDNDDNKYDDRDDDARDRSRSRDRDVEADGADTGYGDEGNTYPDQDQEENEVIYCWQY
jgi:hypothetical protein